VITTNLSQILLELVSILGYTQMNQMKVFNVITAEGWLPAYPVVQFMGQPILEQSMLQQAQLNRIILLKTFPNLLKLLAI
jgi:hypothetical protein